MRRSTAAVTALAGTLILAASAASTAVVVNAVSAPATCTPPTVTENATSVTWSNECTVPKPAPETVTVKETVTAAPSSSPSPSPTQDPSPSPTTPTGTTAPAPVGLPCSPGSFFRDDVRNNTVSATETAEFRSFMATHPDQKAITWPKVNLNDSWSGIHHIGKATDPVWKVTGGNTGDARLRILQTQGFHLADAVLNANPTGSEDRLLVVYDPVFGYVAQMADTTPNFATRTITVSNAGIMWYSSNCLDYRNPRTDDQRNFTSRGRVVPSMQIPAAWLQQAINNGTGVGYPMHIFFVETNTADGFTHPMVNDESDKAGWGGEGWRIRIDPTVNLAARGLTPGCLAIARTLQESGGYLGDNSGSATQLKLGHPSQYPSSMGLSTDCMKGKVSWSDFQVVTPGQQ